MLRSMRPHALLILAALTAVVSATSVTEPPTNARRTVMSFHNRLTLNRLAVDGHTSAEVMLLVRPGRLDEAVTDAARLSGRVLRAESDVGYLRAEVPLDRLVEFATGPAVDAYQIASLATVSWYPGAHSRSRGEIERTGETTPVGRPLAERRPELAELTPAEARGAGFTADEDAGVGAWNAAHPMFDGRGVTIAFLESGLVEFGHPTFRAAKTLDGADISKFAGIVNTLGPDDPDATRVNLTTEIHAIRTWQEVDGRTYVLPRAGRYRFGVFRLWVTRKTVQSFAVIQSADTDEVWVDTNSDGDFRDEAPVVDANTRMDVRHLRITHPRPIDLAFVFTRGRSPNTVHLYTARGGHHTMSVSVATGNATDTGLASGVAPGARALVVRYTDGNPVLFRMVLEGYLDVMRRPDVDILSDSTGLETAPDAAREFAGLFFERLIQRYHKPIFHSAGNAPPYLSSVSAAGGVFSVGGVLGPASFASLYGGTALPRIVVHRASAAGPSVDGALEPEFLAPEHRISAGVWIDDGYLPLPKNAPAKYLPAGYEISCCTSASGPYAAGVAALLLSAAKQTGVSYSVDRFGRALKVGARFLSDWPAYTQGNGVLDVNAAWQELQRTAEVPRIVATAANAHALTPYVGQGAEGPGLFEQYGWTAGQRGRRLFHLTRQSGAAGPIRYRVSWTGNDGTFAAPPTVTLPLRARTALPVTIHVRTAGAHSAILSLHDPGTDAVVFRTQATIVAPAAFDPRTADVQLTGTIPLMQTREHFLAVPEGVSAMSIEMEIHEGALAATVTPPHGLTGSYFWHVRTGANRSFTKGRYRFLWPSPAAGTWSLNLGNVSASQQRDLSLVSTTTAACSVTVRLLGASIHVGDITGERVEALTRNIFGPLREPAIEVSRATRRLVDDATLPTGLPNLLDIDVPNGAASLHVTARALSSEERTLELSLFDCTSGECFLWNFTLPAESKPAMVVRNPTPGRWIAAVNAAPAPAKQVRFSFEDVIATDAVPPSSAAVGPQGPGARWTQTVDVGGTMATDGRDGVLLYELFDLAAARDTIAHPWENREGVDNLAARPVAVATTIGRVK